MSRSTFMRAAQVAAAAACCIVGPSLAQTPQPPGTPGGRTWYVAAAGTVAGDGSQASPITLARAAQVMRSGDVLLFHTGDLFHAPLPAPKAIRDVTYGIYGGTAHATFDAPTAGLFLLAGGTISLAHLDFIDASRDPTQVSSSSSTTTMTTTTAPAFVPHMGQVNLAFRQCSCTFHLSDCAMQWGAINLDAEGSNEQGSTIDRCLIGPSYGIRQRSQGIFMSGQVGTQITNCFFDTNGWYPGVSGAGPTNQNHAIYSHDGNADVPPAISGPYTAIGNTFYNASAGGPTADTGAIVRGNLIYHCANDGSHMAAWTGGAQGEFTDNLVVGGFFDALSATCKVAGNQFFETGAMVIGIDVPAGRPPAWRTAANVVDVEHNVAYGYAGALVDLHNAGGGQVIDQANLTLPANPTLDHLIRQSIASRTAIGLGP